jgi:hypothetical protein
MRARIVVYNDQGSVKYDPQVTNERQGVNIVFFIFCCLGVILWEFAATIYKSGWMKKWHSVHVHEDDPFFKMPESSGYIAVGERKYYHNSTKNLCNTEQEARVLIEGYLEEECRMYQLKRKDEKKEVKPVKINVIKL